eukprot:scaffold34612_cov165-Amphora_coffeaeformis.AAC.6
MGHTTRRAVSRLFIFFRFVCQRRYHLVQLKEVLLRFTLFTNKKGATMDVFAAKNRALSFFATRKWIFEGDGSLVKGNQNDDS